MKLNSRYFSSENKNVKRSTIKQFPVRKIYTIFNSLSSNSSLRQNNLKVNSNIGNFIIIIIIIIIMALQLFMQSFGHLNQFLPSSSNLYKGPPIWHFWLLYIFSNTILPAYLWSSYWPSWIGFPGVYCLDHSCFLDPFNVTKSSQSLYSNEVYYVLVFYYFIQFLVGFYSPNTTFIDWAKYFP